jgi:hypothetical protein
MVNFDNDTTTNKPLKELVSYIILQRHNELIDAIEYYELKQFKDRENGLPELKSKAIGLFFSIMEMLDKDISKERPIKNTKKEYTSPQEVITDIRSDDEDKIYKAIIYMKFFIYSKGITKGDTRGKIDFSDPEEDNEDAGV